MSVSRSLAGIITAWLAVVGCIHGVILEVKEANSTCIKANLSALFSISYNTTNSTNTVQVSLPNSTTVDERRSSCGDNGGSPSLVMVFGPGHALGLSFSTNGSLYSVANLTLQYNLSDTSVFPNASGSGVVTVVSDSVGIQAAMNSTYRCMSHTTIALDNATATFYNMRLEAYMPGNDLSPKESVCTADSTSPTASPTTTTAAPAPTPPRQPEQGNYSLTNNGSVCLLALMGLQLNITYLPQSQDKAVQELLNLDPNVTHSSGSCGANRTTLVLTQESTIMLSFYFTLNSTAKMYHLSGITLQANLINMTAPFFASNMSLGYLRSTLGHSYMCKAEQTLAVDPTFSINTFDLKVQPFGVTEGQFAAAEECLMDQDQMLIPIIVGAILAGLVLITLIAYLIGKKRSHAGYQSI
ncbi:lysosome-associated membrane glycoprotein 1a [Pholidichthys leucotaenia]